MLEQLYFKENQITHGPLTQLIRIKFIIIYIAFNSILTLIGNPSTSGMFEKTIPEVPFIFVRHGTTNWEMEKVYDGFIDYELNEQGIADANRAAELLQGKLKNPNVYCSSFLRAIETCKIIQQKNHFPHYAIVPGLRGREYGCLSSVKEEVLKLGKEKRFEEMEAILPPTSESKNNFEYRCLVTLFNILSENKHTNRTVLIVSHDEVFKVFTHYLSNQRLSISKGGTKSFTCKDHQWTVSDIK